MTVPTVFIKIQIAYAKKKVTTMSFLPLHDETICVQCMFHGISDNALVFKLCIFVPTISFYQYYVQAHQHSALGPNKLLPLEFMDDTGFPSEFPQAKAQQKFTVESIFLQLLLYMILIHTINDEPQYGEQQKETSNEWLGLQLYKKASLRKRFTVIQ